MERVESLCTAVRNVKQFCHGRTWFGGSLKRFDTGLSSDLAAPLLGDIPKGIESRDSTGVCILTFIAALIMIADKRRQPKCVLASEWLNRMWHVHSVECYSTLKKESLPGTARMSRGNASRNRTKVPRSCSHEALRAARFAGTERRAVAARGGESGRRWLRSSCGIQFGKMKEFWKWMVVMLIQQWGSAQCQITTLNNG